MQLTSLFCGSVAKMAADLFNHIDRHMVGDMSFQDDPVEDTLGLVGDFCSSDPQAVVPEVPFSGLQESTNKYLVVKSSPNVAHMLHLPWERTKIDYLRCILCNVVKALTPIYRKATAVVTPFSDSTVCEADAWILPSKGRTGLDMLTVLTHFENNVQLYSRALDLPMPTFRAIHTWIFAAFKDFLCVNGEEASVSRLLRGFEVCRIIARSTKCAHVTENSEALEQQYKEHSNSMDRRCRQERNANGFSAPMSRRTFLSTFNRPHGFGAGSMAGMSNVPPVPQGHSPAISAPDTNFDDIFSSECDGLCFLTGGSDKLIRCWKRDEVLATVPGHSSSISSIFHLGGRRFITTSSDYQVKLWNVCRVDGSLTLEAEDPFVDVASHMRPVRSLAGIMIQGEMLVMTGSMDCTIKLWHSKSRRCLKTFRGHNGSIECIQALPDNQSFLSGSVDETVRLWRIDQTECFKKFVGHNGYVGALELISDAMFVSGSSDSVIRLWHLVDSDVICSYTGHTGPVTCLAKVKPNEELFLSSSIDRTIRLWNANVLDSGTCLKVYCGHTGPVFCLAMCYGGDAFITGSRDSTVRVWVTNAHEKNNVKRSRLTLRGHQGSVLSVAIIQDGAASTSAV